MTDNPQASNLPEDDDDDIINQPDYIREDSLGYLLYFFPYTQHGLSRIESVRRMWIEITRLEQLSHEHWGLLSNPIKMRSMLEEHNRNYDV